MQCGTPHVYFLRFINPEVYIAASEEGRFLKIGTSEESLNRVGFECHWLRRGIRLEVDILF